MTDSIKAALIINEQCHDIQGILRVGTGVIILIVDGGVDLPSAAGAELTPRQRKEISASMSRYKSSSH